MFFGGDLVKITPLVDVPDPPFGPLGAPYATPEEAADAKAAVTVIPVVPGQVRWELHGHQISAEAAAELLGGAR